MSQRRLEYVWVACLAVLFNVFAMPLSSVMSAPQKELLMWGSFCSTGGTELVAISLGNNSDEPAQNSSHANSPHSCCCSNATVLALPTALPFAHLRSFKASRSPANLEHRGIALRRLWPSINPRASPLS
ncbi:MAG: DUF2946 domain-containing protein [Pseudomonas sp.]|nr:DUF2946 domain-containing protein [Pseudomonas sp.]